MGAILSFERKKFGDDPSPPTRNQQGGTAEIVILPCIRYERRAASEAHRDVHGKGTRSAMSGERCSNSISRDPTAA
ncbi:hypothetical protein [Jiella mangrovi]|uniref:Uncharacterized protein n=1 Tax=Jiella mangrovi TaxID=2821407 RepID=A0ABS4BME9_9HYPH|nr:hypothetical protein [Jiella mangrovi]MBP0617912.1 hypothetical protein [Jiella mangrovi]